ncbi:unnamed protein product [Schistosoma haematobium]|nr:unnamed protein product [Schistosoma haematobium]
MLASNIRHPKEVTVRVYKAENLRVAPRSDHKQKKVSQKWKCVVLGGKKKISTECIYAPDGNPVWNFETTLKIATRGDPVVLLVSDSEDNHVGQVVVPGVTIPPKPTDPSVSLTDNSRLCIMEMEQTKKTEIGFGRLYFWIWVEEYRSEESKSRSTMGSILSLSSLHLHKDKGSTPNSLNYSGSVISLSSNNDEHKKKKRWYKKVANHALHVPAPIRQSRSPSNSVLNTKPMNNGYNPFDYYQQNLNEEDGVIEEKDGSVLGAYSELTANSLTSSSAFATNQLKRRNSMHPSKRSGSIASNIDISMKDPDEHLKNKPELLRIAPKCGPSSGGTELTIYCRFLTTEIMKRSTVFVGDHPVSRDDWFLDESSQSDLSQLRIHMPSLQPGRYSIYIDSVEFGRILCNQEFTYLHSDVNLIQSPRSSLAAAKQNFLPTGESELVSSLGTPPKIKQSYKRSSQSNLPNRTINSAKFNQNVNLILTRRVSLSNSQIPFNEDTDAADCVSTLSGETSQTMEYNEFNKTHHGSDRSAASGRSKSIMGASEEEGLKLENEALRSLLNDANHLISTIKSHTITLETELNAKVNDVDRLAEELCRLKNRLLLDGLTQYLEKV